MKNIVFKRVLLDLILAFCVVQGWWFIAAPIALVGIWSFPYFVEIIIAGLIYDSLFGIVEGEGIAGYTMTVASVIIFCLLALIKKVVRK